jgi:ABC-type nitrate/sulfonate/bicarbonate transport system substrate-binding protein
VELTNIPSASLFDALENKTVELIVVPELYLTRLIQSGYVELLSRAEDVVGPYQISVLAFGARLIDENPDLGARFLAAYLKGVRKYNEGKTEENLELLAEKTGDDIDLLRDACWISIGEDGWIDFDEVIPFQQFSVNMEQLDEPITEEQFWAPSVLEDALNLLEED